MMLAVTFVADSLQSGFAMEDIPYSVGGPDAVQKLDGELKADLNELKTELEENEILRGASRAARYFCYTFVFVLPINP